MKLLRFSSVIGLIVILSLVFPLAVFADTYQVDGDIVTPGNQNSISLTAVSGDMVSTRLSFPK